MSIIRRDHKENTGWTVKEILLIFYRDLQDELEISI